jgi:transketolase
MLSAHRIKQLELLANEIRQDVIRMLEEAESGHSAGSLDIVDVLVSLYFQVLKHNPDSPKLEERDRFVLSAGHLCPALYATLAHAGYFEKKELLTLRKLNSRFQGHPHNLSLPGIENSSGPLGQGLSQACGMALSALLDKEKWRVYCLMSDGEQDEGQTWEAAMFASKYKLSNLTAIIDRNNIQIGGYTEQIMPLEPLREKYESFGWHVFEVDGHNIEKIIETLENAGEILEKPQLVIAHTIAGKGVDFMEKDYQWHGQAPDPKEAREALKELRTLGGKIKNE